LKLGSTVEDTPQGSRLLDEMTFTIIYNGDTLTSGKHLSDELTNQELVCIPAKSMDSLDLRLDFNKDAGNDLQATNFKLLFNFSVTDESCGSAPIDGADGGPKWPLPPNTGDETALPPTNESSVVFYSSVGVIVVSLFLTLLFGLLVLFSKRKKDGSKKDPRRPVYTPKRKGGLKIVHDKKR
jgi:hypothetical protein